MAAGEDDDFSGEFFGQLEALHFPPPDEEGVTYAWKQPATPAEHALAEAALEHCPTETIGSDGEGAW